MLAALYAVNLLLLVLLLGVMLRKPCPSRVLSLLALAELCLIVAHTLLFAVSIFLL